MTLKQKRFILEYRKDQNATQAAIRAGYSKKGAHVEACRLLKNPKILAEIEKRDQKVFEKHEITAERILAELAKVAFSNMKKYATWGPGGIELYPSSRLTEDEAACVSEVSQTRGKTSSIRFKLHSKEKALELLGKRFGLFDSDPEPEGETAPPSQIYYEHEPAKLNGVNGH